MGLYIIAMENCAIEIMVVSRFFFWWGGEYNGHFYTITKSSSIIILDNYELNPIGINYFGCFFVILNL